MYRDHLEYKVNEITLVLKLQGQRDYRKAKCFFLPNMFAFENSGIMFEILTNEPNPDLILCPKGQVHFRKE